MKYSLRLALACIACCSALATTAHAGSKFPTKLFLSSDGLALSSFPGRHNLTQTISVSRTKGGKQANWKAVSNRSWLSVTSEGTTGGTLTVTAKAGKLTKDTLYTAKVTVSTAGADFSDKEALYVGFWIGSADPSTVTVQQLGTNIVANPVSPIAYIAANGTIYEYNVYSGALVGTVPNIGNVLGALAISSDGQTLFVADAQPNQIFALDAATGKQLHVFPVSTQLQYGLNMVYARPFGQPALYVAGGSILSYPSGDALAGGLPNAALAVTPNGQNLYSVTVGISPGTINNYSVALNGKTLTTTPITSTSTGSNCQALAVSHDAAHVYPACGAPYEFDAYDGKTLADVQTLPAAPYPNNAGIDENNNFVGALNGLYQPDDVFEYDPNGNLVGEVPTTEQSYSGGEQAAAMGISGDATRVVTITPWFQNNPQTLMFRSLP